MRNSYSQALKLSLVHEGGFVDNPHDPGGATNKGITQAVYDDWRTREGLPRRSVKFINDFETGAIYRKQYWDQIKGDDLPAGVDYCVFDFAVNSGVNRAVRFLQRSVGVFEDGKLGEITLGRVRAVEPKWLINDICIRRMQFLESLNAFRYFGKGWTKRVAEVESEAEHML
jgi:lysozyme family protein